MIAFDPTPLPLPGAGPDPAFLDEVSRRPLVKVTFTGSEVADSYQDRPLWFGQDRFTFRRDVTSSVEAMARPQVLADTNMDRAERDFGFDDFLLVDGSTFEDAVQSAQRLTAGSAGGTQASAVIQAASGAFYVTPLGPVPTSLGSAGAIPYERDHDTHLDLRGAMQPGDMEGASEWQLVGSERPGAQPSYLPPSYWGGHVSDVVLHSVQAMDPSIKAYVHADGWLDLRHGDTALARHA